MRYLLSLYIIQSLACLEIAQIDEVACNFLSAFVTKENIFKVFALYCKCRNEKTENSELWDF